VWLQSGYAVLAKPISTSTTIHQPIGHGMNPTVHKLFLTRCDLEESRQVSAVDCEKCSMGSVVDGRSRVLCAGVTKFFSTPCYHGMRSSATVGDCSACRFGAVGDDRLRVMCEKP